MNKRSGKVAEGRRNSRIQRDFPAVLFKLEDDTIRCKAVVEDISANGVKITLDDPDFVEKGEEIRVIFECDELQSEDDVELRVIVRGIWKDAKGKTNLGCQAAEGDNGLVRLEETWLALMFDEIHKTDDISYF